MSDHRLSGRAFWIPFLIHGCVGLGLYFALATFLPRFGVLYAELKARGELPLLTDFVVRLWEHANWFFPTAFVFDGAVFFFLNRLPRKAMLATRVWFIAVVVAMVALCVVAAKDSVQFLIEMMSSPDRFPGQH